MNDTTHQKALSAIHDDPHGAAWRPDVEEHVGRCPACQKTVRALRSFVGSMRRRQQTVAAPPELVAQVCRTVQAEQAAAVRRRWRLTVAAIPVALIVGVLVGLWLA